MPENSTVAASTMQKSDLQKGVKLGADKVIELTTELEATKAELEVSKAEIVRLQTWA